jgi:hypothetical protein
MNRPLRTGEVLLGLLRDPNIAAVLPSSDIDHLAGAVREALESDAEMPAPWADQPRITELPGAPSDVCWRS